MRSRRHVSILDLYGPSETGLRTAGENVMGRFQVSDHSTSFILHDALYLHNSPIVFVPSVLEPNSLRALLETLRLAGDERARYYMREINNTISVVARVRTWWLPATTQEGKPKSTLFNRANILKLRLRGQWGYNSLERNSSILYVI